MKGMHAVHRPLLSLLRESAKCRGVPANVDQQAFSATSDVNAADKYRRNTAWWRRNSTILQQRRLVLHVYMIHTTRYGTCLVRVLAASRPTAMSMHTTPNRTRLYFLLCKFNVWFSTNNVDNNTQQLRYDCLLDRKAKSLTFSVRSNCEHCSRLFAMATSQTTTPLLSYSVKLSTDNIFYAKLAVWLLICKTSSRTW